MGITLGGAAVGEKGGMAPSVGMGLAARRRGARAMGRGITIARLPAHTRRL
jgi:hypothetical protein